MALSPTQIERVREITLSNSLTETAVLVSRLSAEQEAETIADIADWELVRKKFTRVARVGSIHLRSDKSDARFAITNRVRRRLGLTGIESEADLSTSTEICYSHPQPSGACCE
jgi:hypothetical protein